MSSPNAIAVPPARHERIWLLAIVLAALLASGIAPKDRLTWLLEVIWVMVAIPIIALNWR
jgi:putative membrane protein